MCQRTYYFEMNFNTLNSVERNKFELILIFLKVNIGNTYLLDNNMSCIFSLHVVTYHVTESYYKKLYLLVQIREIYNEKYLSLASYDSLEMNGCGSDELMITYEQKAKISFFTFILVRLVCTFVLVFCYFTMIFFFGHSSFSPYCI